MMLAETETQQARRILTRGVAIIAAVTFIGTGLLIYFGNQHTTEWATYRTIEDSSWDLARAKPSIQIVPP